MNKADLPSGVMLIPLPSHRDERGTLVALDRDTLPFEPVRTFVIRDVPPGATRGGRATACAEFLFAAVGTCRVTVSGATRRATVELDQSHGVLVPAGLVVELSDFAPQSVIVVLAPTPFAKAGHSDGLRDAPGA